MKRHILIFSALVAVCITAALLYAQTQKGTQQSLTDRVDLETETLVGKRLERTETDANGQKIYHFLYRVEARQTAKSLPRYIVDHRYSITYTTTGFKPGDTITLLSANEETETDSPIWLYNVTYVGGGSRKITFDTSGSVYAPSFSTVSGETECPACGCDQSNCSNHWYFCDLCNPGCSINGCPAPCTGCSCMCHGTTVCEYCEENPCVCPEYPDETPEPNTPPPPICPPQVRCCPQQTF